MITELDSKNFETEIKSGLKLVDFYTTWCHYCKQEEPILKELNENGFWIGKVDCDKEQEIAKEYNVTGFPSFILFKNGENVAQFIGYHTKSELLNKLMHYI